MGESGSSALTPEQWETRDYRQSARDLDRWAKAAGRAGKDDATEYVAKLGLSDGEAVIAMNRAHDRVLIPTPARPALAALALADQPFGFTPEDVRVAEDAAERTSDGAAAGALRHLADKIQRLLPPR